MGVNTFLLDRRTVKLVISGTRYSVGTLRRFYKVTELDGQRITELDAATRLLSPIAAMVMDPSELRLATDPERITRAHLVLGWDEGRGSVTDQGWDYLPSLGYAVSDPESGDYVLFENRGGFLHALSAERAHELGTLGKDGKLTSRGQPHIRDCSAVRAYIHGYAEADCTFESGATVKLLVGTDHADLPPPSWFAGKRPMDVEHFTRQAAL